jgi:hypothetical protein
MGVLPEVFGFIIYHPAGICKIICAAPIFAPQNRPTGASHRSRQSAKNLRIKNEKEKEEISNPTTVIIPGRC